MRIFNLIAAATMSGCWYRHVHKHCCSEQPLLKTVLFSTCVPLVSAAVLLLDILTITVVTGYLICLAACTTIAWVFTSQTWREIFNEVITYELPMDRAERLHYGQLEQRREVLRQKKQKA